MTTTAAETNKIREYETIYILRSDVDGDTAERVQARVSDVIGREAGKMVKVEAWGRRRLAYPIAKAKKGVYMYVKYVGGGGLVGELERNLRLQDAVLKFQTVQTKPNVNLAGLTIDPEELKLGKIELPAEEEEVESRERQLGLVEGGDHHHSHRGPADDFEDEAEPDAVEEDAAAKTTEEEG